MILRVFRGNVIPGNEERLVQFIRREAIVQALTIPGLLSFQPAVRRTDPGLELVIASTWDDFGALLATGRDLAAPLVIPSVAGMLQDARADHYELVVGGARGMPIAGTTLRLARGRIRQHMESLYFERLRAIVQPLLDEASLLALHAGRRVVGDRGATDEVMGVTLWSDAETLRRAAHGAPEQPLGGGELGELYEEEPTIEQFEALTVSEGTRGAPAILLADDDRRYLHVTPSAAKLTGRSVARLLTMRVDDLADSEVRSAVPAMWNEFVARGALDGPFALGRPDGTSVEVRFTARARTPWPGCHATLLTPADATDKPDLDRALAEAGFLSRYSVAI